MTYVHCNLRNEEIISTHILTKRMTAPSFTANCEYLFQLTSSRRGWLFEGMKYNSGKPFQLTSSRRGWPIPTVFPSVFLTFQLTSSRRGWHFPHVFLISWIIISTHILTKRMTLLKQGRDTDILFQLTSSRRGWLPKLKKYFYLPYFNSHPHEEDDNANGRRNHLESISTHILTKRMTLMLFTSFVLILFQLTSSRRGWRGGSGSKKPSSHISTHILTKRMTRTRMEMCERAIFQLTSSRRGWQIAIYNYVICSSISTHILTKRMTELDEEETKKETFQLTSSRRGWQSTNWFVANTKHFNSHPHEEDDEFACLL